MKSVIRAAMLAVAGVFAIAAVAHAETLEVRVPFTFLVGSTQMPAGQYRIERDANMPSSVLLIRGEHGNTARLFVQTSPLTGARPAGDAPALVFVPDEIANRLTQVWGSGAIGQEVAAPRGKARLIGQIVVLGQSRS